jgi:hypothetical protein
MGAPEALLVAESAPQVPPLHPAPASVQLTPLLAESFATVAVKFDVPLTGTVAVVCDKLTVIAVDAVTVIVAEPVFVPSDTEVAVSVTVPAVVGAV